MVSELVIVLGEDVAALLGLLFALVSVVLSVITGNPIFDAVGSIGIGVLLVLVSIFLAIKIKGLLIGQSATDEDCAQIRQFLASQPEIESVLNLITLQLGPQIMVAVKVKMAGAESADQLIANINRCEAGLRKLNPSIQWIFFEPDVE